MAYDRYPAIDEDYQFPPEVRGALATSTELRNQVVPMTNTQRNNLAGDELWEDRIIFNTSTNRFDRYEGATWIQITTEPAGVVKEYGGDTAPDMHVLADGGVYPRDGIYAPLFAVYGTKYNTGGEPSTHFRVVNRKGKTAVGKDSSQTEFDTLGKTGGSKTHTLSAGEMPVHAHSGRTGDDGPDHGHNGGTDGQGSHAHQQYLGDKTVLDGPFASHTTGVVRQYSGSPGDGTTAAGVHSHNVSVGGATARHQHDFGTSNAGSGSAHNNLQPYVTMNFIITL